jgi:quinohemoprotein ethanol dehydrogenase
MFTPVIRLVAAPVTYAVRGRQYVSIAVGWGGVFGQSQRATDRKTPGTVYAFALGGTAKLSAFVDYQLGNLLTGVKYTPADVPAVIIENLDKFLLGGPMQDKGMPDFSDILYRRHGSFQPVTSTE